MWPNLELIGVYPSRFSGVFFTGKEVFPFSIAIVSLLPSLRHNARRVQVRLRARYPERDQDVARVGGGEAEVGRGDIEHILRGALRSKVRGEFT